MFNLFKKKKVEEQKNEESLIQHYRKKAFSEWKEPTFNRDDVIKSIFQRDFSKLMPKRNGKVVAMDSDVCNCNFKGADIPDDILKFYGSHFFIGWQACALLRQNPYIDKACTIPAQDAISPDYKISYIQNNENKSENDEEKLAEMKQVSDKDFNIKEICYRANVDKKTFGISLVVPVIDGVDYEKPYNIERVKKGSYKGMTVVEPYWTAPQLDGNAVSNPMNTGFQEPTWWRMPNGTLVHKSWCVKRCNSELPDILKPTYYYGGVPLTQKIYERVYAAEKTANEAPLLALTKRLLIVDANIENLVANECEAQKAIKMAQYYRDNFSMWFKNPDDQVQQIDTSLSDFDALVMTQYQLVASIAEMPATKLLKTQPKGFNATGEYEQKDYIQSLQAIQEQDYIPILKMHYELFTKSYYGKVVDLAIVFNPIDTPSEKEVAEVAKIWSDVDSNYISAGVMSAEEVRDVRRSLDDSPYSALADDIEGEVSEEVEQAADEALDDAEFESKHPRDERGRFTSGSNQSIISFRGSTPNEMTKEEAEEFVKKKLEEIRSNNKKKIEQEYQNNKEIAQNTFYPEEISGIKRGNEMTFDEADNGNVNPEFDPYNASTAFNCQSCVVAFEARLRGYNVKANLYGSEISKELEYSGNKAWINKETGEYSKLISPDDLSMTTGKPYNAKKYYLFLDNIIKNGERYILGFPNKGRGNNGHTVNILKDDKGLLLYDAQSNKKYRKRAMFDYMKENMRFERTTQGIHINSIPQLYRVDNMSFNPKFFDVMIGRNNEYK